MCVHTPLWDAEGSSKSDESGASSQVRDLERLIGVEVGKHGKSEAARRLSQNLGILASGEPEEEGQEKEKEEGG